jgi:hypothetical protein
MMTRPLIFHEYLPGVFIGPVRRRIAVLEPTALEQPVGALEVGAAF